MTSDIEIHINTSDLIKEDIVGFETFCKSIDAKPIIIELSEGAYYRQPMISKVIKCLTKIDLDKELARLESNFSAQGYPIIRTKIEVPPWHRNNVEDYYDDKSKTYYEWHGKVYVKNESLIKEICERHQAKLSRNSLRSDLTRKFITMREKENENAIIVRISELKESLALERIPIVKEELEYCIYDSLRSLDKGWLN